jgi:hypothetical protein
VGLLEGRQREAEIRRLRTTLGLRRFDPAGQLDLVRRLPSSSLAAARSICRLISLENASRPAQRRRVWCELRRVFLEDATRQLPRLEATTKRALWYRGQRRFLHETMPTLASLLEEPRGAGRLQSLLSYLRMLSPYYLANGSDLPPAAWARANEYVFDLNELRIIPVTESFRRFVIESRNGPSAVEIKMPGERDRSSMLSRRNFDVAAELWDARPPDPPVVRPVFLGRFAGALRMHGRVRRYDADRPLTLMVFDYRDGKRMSNADLHLERVARQAGSTVIRLRRDAFVDMAVAAIRIHRLGWLGHTRLRNDMHMENVRILENGRAELVADFGVFHRPRPMSAEVRAWDVSHLLGEFRAEHDPDRPRRFDFAPASADFLREIHPDVVERLCEGVGSRARPAIEREVGNALLTTRRRWSG